MLRCKTAPAAGLLTQDDENEASSFSLIRSCGGEPNQRQHAASATFLRPVGIVKVEMASGADATVVDFEHALRLTLFDNLRCEIDLVVRRANAWAELDDHLRWIGSEAIKHLPDRVGDDAELGAFAPGMHQTNGWCAWIDNVNSATVSDVNAQRDTPLIRYNAVAARKFLAASARLINHRDFVSMNLFGGDQRPITYSDCLADFTMCFLEPR